MEAGEIGKGRRNRSCELIDVEVTVKSEGIGQVMISDSSRVVLSAIKRKQKEEKRGVIKQVLKVGEIEDGRRNRSCEITTSKESVQ